MRRGAESLVYEPKYYEECVAANRRSPEELKGPYVLELYFYRLGCLLLKNFPTNVTVLAYDSDINTCGQDISHRAIHMYAEAPPPPERINSLWFCQRAPDNNVDDRF